MSYYIVPFGEELFSLQPVIADKNFLDNSKEEVREIVYSDKILDDAVEIFGII